MRNWTICVAVAVSLAMPAFASADETGFSAKSIRQEEPQVEIRFVLKLVNGKPRRIERFRFDNVAMSCDQGIVLVGNAGSPLPNIKVNARKRFRERFFANGRQERVDVGGRVRKGGRKVVGKIRVRGEFPLESGEVATNCDSGKLPWRSRAR